MSGVFRSMAVFNYRTWFVGATVSNVGTWMQRTTQDWIVLTELTEHDAVAVGVTMALQFGPALLLTPLTGLAADVFDRRKLLLITQVIMAVLALAFGLLYFSGSATLWVVYLFALLLGIVSAFDAPVRHAIVSELVPPPLLPNAVGLNAASINAARMVGPAVAGILIALVGAGWVFLINTATFAATVLAILALRTRTMHLPPPRTGSNRGRLRAGLTFVLAHRDLSRIMALVLVMGALGMNLPIFIATMATIEFHQDATGFGALSSVAAIGSLIGALLAAARAQARLGTIVFATASFSVTAVAAAVSPNMWVFGAALATLGLLIMTVLNTSNAYLQGATPPELRGRVIAIYVAVVLGSKLLGAPLLGWVANEAGPRWALAVGALGGLIPTVAAIAYWMRTRSTRVRWDSSRRPRLRVETTMRNKSEAPHT